MQLGKALLGAIVGACVGIVLLLVVYLVMGMDKVWLSIPFALITGLGVRMFVSTGGHASYVRGALTMLIALAAYIGGWMIVAQVATAKANAPATKPSLIDQDEASKEPGDSEAKDEEDADATKDAEAKDEEKDTAVPPPNAAPRTSQPATPRAPAPRSDAYTPWDIICLAVAALVAYEMGRGSGASAPANHSGQPIPAGTHPDA